MSAPTPLLASAPALRDLAGVGKGHEGKSLRSGLLYRGPALTLCNEKDWQWIKRNLRTVIDLRDHGERTREQVDRKERSTEFAQHFPLTDAKTGKVKVDHADSSASDEYNVRQGPAYIASSLGHDDVDQEMDTDAIVAKNRKPSRNEKSKQSDKATKSIKTNKDTNSDSKSATEDDQSEQRGVRKTYNLPLLNSHTVQAMVRRHVPCHLRVQYTLLRYVFCNKARALKSLLPVFWGLGLQGLTDIFIEGSHKELLAVLKVIATPGNQPIVFHCSAGKDRTGFVAAMSLHILGVDREKIIKDYTLTEGLLPDPYRSAILKSGCPEEWLASPAPLMRYTFDRIEELFGSVDEFLDAVGFDEQWRRQMREIYLE